MRDQNTALTQRAFCDGDGAHVGCAGRHAIWTWCLAQFLASFVYVLACATIFVILVHFIPAINDSAESFFYVLLMSWLMQLIMEAVDWNLIEATKNELLSVASGMVVIGSFFIFAGFFIPVEEMVRPIFWMAYTMPTYYIFSGTLYVYLHGVDYDAGDGQTVSGDTVLNTYFNVDYSDQGDWRHWMDLLIAVAFLLVFRFQHYQFMVLNTKMLGASLPAGDDNADSDGNAASDDNADSDDNTTVAYERPEPQQQPKPTNYLNVKANKTMPTNTKPLTRVSLSLWCLPVRNRSSHSPHSVLHTTELSPPPRARNVWRGRAMVVCGLSCGRVVPWWCAMVVCHGSVWFDCGHPSRRNPFHPRPCLPPCLAHAALFVCPIHLCSSTPANRLSLPSEPL